MSTPIAIVTGANRGLGLQVSRELAQRGMNVVMTGRHASRVAQAASELSDQGLKVHSEELDVSSDESVADFVQRFTQRFSRVDVLVNNAGAIFDGTNDRGREDAATAFNVPAATVLQSVNTNAMGAYRLTSALLPLMNDAGYGRVVNVSSGMGALRDMGSGWPAYRVSKTALNAVTRVFHAVAASNVKVNAVCPGWVRTDMGGASATRSVAQGAAGIVTAATLPDDGPSGVFLRDGEVIDW